MTSIPEEQAAASLSNNVDNEVPSADVVVSAEVLAAVEEDTAATPPVDKKQPWYCFEGVAIAQGYNWSGLGRGALVMSNIFLSTSFVYLAQEEAGCLDEEGEVIEDCDGEAYGFQPASFIANIAVISSVLSALFMPLIGAMVDYTKHRKTVGIVASTLMIIIQVVQIGTVSETWFAMAIIQAFSGFLYQALVLVMYAYLPDMSYRVDEPTMTKFTSKFTMTQFASQGAFLLLITVLSIAIDLGPVEAAQMSQAINAVWSGFAFYCSWKLMEAIPARRVLPVGKSLLTQGFVNNAKTVRDINKFYKKGTRWYFLALIFAEAGVNSFTVLAVVFLGEQLGLDFVAIGAFFLVSLIFTIPGSFLGSYVTRKLDPKRSWRLVMVVLFFWSSIGAIVLDYLPESLAPLAFVWGCGIGLCLGWYYPTENLFFSMCLPKGQEAELAGFFVYCSQILGWLPPLIFSIIVEADVSQTYGVVALSAFILLAAGIVSCASPWSEILEECGRLPNTEAGKGVGGVDGGSDLQEDCLDAAQSETSKTPDGETLEKFKATEEEGEEGEEVEHDNLGDARSA